jgi:ATP-binding cassette, subfamily C, bacterial CydCD
MNLDPRLLALLRSTRTLLALTILFGLGVGISIIAQADLLSQIIAQVFIHNANLADVWNAMLVLLALFGARALLSWGSEASAFQIAARIKTDLRVRLYAQILARGPLFTRAERTGELTHTLTEGIEALEAYFSQYLPQLVLAVLVPLLVLAFVFPLDWLSALMLLMTGPLIPLFMILIGNAADALTRKQFRELGWLSAHFLDVLQGLTTLKIFGRSREQIETISRVSEQYRITTTRVLRVAFLSAFALEMIATLSTAIVAVQVGLRLLYGQLEFEQAFFVLILAPDFYLPLRLLGTRFHAGMSGVAAASRIFEILATEDGRRRTESISHRSTVLGRISFEDVHYTYADRRHALDGVSFAIEPGQRVAIVGATGAGKSTIVNLLLRFIEPTQGKILGNGISLDPISPEAWRAQIAWVPQLPYLFNTSIAENIALARPGAERDDVIRAAQQANADAFIRALPQGYATRIGEQGARLSRGQAQRIALARAFFADAPILILDEATAHLDGENEAQIQQAIERLARHRTTLIVTHRLATVEHADKIVVLDEGRVVESGTHATLIQQQGAYYRLVSAWQDSERGAQSDFEGTLETQTQTQSLIENRKPQTENLKVQLSGYATFARLLTLIAPFKWHIAFAVACGAFTIGSSIGLMATSAYLIASAALHPSIAELAVPIVGVRFFGIARGVFRYLERYISHDVNLRVLARLREWFYAAIEPGAPAQLLAASRRSGDLLARIVGDVETLQNFFVRVLAPPMVALIIAIGMFLFLAGFSPTLVFVNLVFMLLIGLVMPIATQPVHRMANQQFIATRAMLSTYLVDHLQGIADLVAFGRADASTTQVRELNDQLSRAQTQLAWLASASSALGVALANLALWCALWIAIPLVTIGQISGVQLPVIVLAVAASFEGVLVLPAAFQSLEANLFAAHRLFEVADASPQSPIADNSIRPSKSPAPLVLHIRDLSFRFAPNEPLVLDRLNLDVPAGKIVALVGASGTGKTTLINLLLRFWDYESGTITVGEKNLRDLSPAQARQCFAVVTQPIHLFNATIRENLLLARPDATDAEIISVAKFAQIDEFIATLPQGYDTRIGEQGLRLSGGERQRIALARAFLAAHDAPILLLDEATAHLDPLTERAVLSAIRRQAHTTVWITHRMPQADQVDKIIFLP